MSRLDGAMGSASKTHGEGAAPPTALEEPSALRNNEVISTDSITTDADEDHNKGSTPSIQSAAAVAGASDSAGHDVGTEVQPLVTDSADNKEPHGPTAAQEAPLVDGAQRDGTPEQSPRNGHAPLDDDLVAASEMALPSLITDLPLDGAPGSPHRGRTAIADEDADGSSAVVYDPSNADASAALSSDFPEPQSDACSSTQGEGTAPSPAPVTLLGVEEDLRRKRIKKVSHYILGPLLGEGVYGVVRDAIDISAMPQTYAAAADGRARGGAPSHGFRRCAIKMVCLSCDPPQRHGAAAAGGGGGGHGTTPTAPRRATGLRRTAGRRELRVAALFDNEVEQLQRFHNENLIRAYDVFSRYGKEYVVLPIAVCSLQQLVRETQRSAWRRRQLSEYSLLEPQQAHAKPSHAAPRQRAGGLLDGGAARRGAAPNSSERLDSLSFASSRGGAEDSTPHELHDNAVDEYSSASSATTHTADSNSLLEVVSSPSLSSAVIGNGSSSAAAGLTTSAPLLQRRLIEPLLSAALIKGILYQVLCGLAYLHGQNLAHNDLKPSNVLLFENGSVKLTDLGGVGETYSDQGTPLFASPELCRHFYLAAAAESGEGDGVAAEARGEPQRVDAKACDMWCCGMILYYLITGRPGPLLVHLAYFKQLHSRHKLAAPLTRFELYRELAAQKLPARLDDIPDLMHDAPSGAGDDGERRDDGRPMAGGYRPPASASSYSPRSVRHLLACLLAIDPAERITASAALEHRWIAMSFKETKKGACASAGERRPSKRAVDEAIHRGVARRVLQSHHMTAMIRRDHERHLQFVADCCHMLEVPIPPEVFRTASQEPYTATAAPGREAAHHTSAVTGTVVEYGCPARMPPGCVDPELFLPVEEEDYYQRKSGKTEFDVRELCDQPLKVRQLEEYLHNVVLVQCGYRTKADPAYAASLVSPRRPRPAAADVVHPAISALQPPPAAAVAVEHDDDHTTAAHTPSPPHGSGQRRTPPAATVTTEPAAQPAPSPEAARKPKKRQGAAGGPRASEQSSSEQDETMKESSKCLCGLM